MVLISMKNTFFVLQEVLSHLLWWMCVCVCKRHVDGEEDVAAAEVLLVN